MPANPLPFVEFKEEPAKVSDQVLALGGHVIRHQCEGRNYNPGLTTNLFMSRYMQSDYLMVFRSQDVSEYISISTLTLCGVDSDGTIRWAAPLELPEIPGEGVPMQEDGRLFWFDGKLFIAYSNVRLRAKDVTFKQSLVELIPVRPADTCEHAFKLRFTAGPLKTLNYGNNAYLRAGHEKNWQFFEDNGRLAFTYSVNPHVVVCAHSGKHYVSQCKAAEDWTSTWGEMHGGTPPIPISDDMFLTFFNSFIAHPTHQRRYVIGAYVFSRKHDYAITHISNRPLLIGSARDGFLWESPAFWEPIVAFATGALHDERNGRIRLSYGVNDCFAETAVIPVTSIIRSMVHVR